MLSKLIEIAKFASTNGFWLPAAFDALTQKASVSLFFVHVANYLAVAMIIALGIQDLLQGTIAAMLFALAQTIFYLLRRLTKASIDLDDKSINLENDSKEEDKQ